MHCDLRPPDVALVVLGCHLAKFVLRMRINCYYQCSDQIRHSIAIAIHFSDQSSLKSKHLAIRLRFHAVTLTFDHLSTLGVT